MRKITLGVLQLVIATAVLLLMMVGVTGQKRRASAPVIATSEQPLFSEYKGVRLGMTTEQARAKLGSPTMKGDDLDYYVFSDNESAQLAYDTTHKVVTISIDYSAGAPDYRAVVGPTVDQMEDGSLYRLIRYEAQGFWVSYSRAGTNGTVSITIQKISQSR